MEPKCQDKVIRLLLKAGADPNLGDVRGTTPLMHAAQIDAHEAVVSLLQHVSNDHFFQFYKLVVEFYYN